MSDDWQEEVEGARSGVWLAKALGVPEPPLKSHTRKLCAARLLSMAWASSRRPPRGHVVAKKRKREAIEGPEETGDGARATDTEDRIVEQPMVPGNCLADVTEVLSALADSVVRLFTSGTVKLCTPDQELIEVLTVF